MILLSLLSRLWFHSEVMSVASCPKTRRSIKIIHPGRPTNANTPYLFSRCFSRILTFLRNLLCRRLNLHCAVRFGAQRKQHVLLVSFLPPCNPTDDNHNFVDHIPDIQGTIEFATSSVDKASSSFPPDFCLSPPLNHD